MLIASNTSRIIQRIAFIVIFLPSHIILLQNQSNYNVTHLFIKEIKSNSKIELQSVSYYLDNTLKRLANLI